MKFRRKNSPLTVKIEGSFITIEDREETKTIPSESFCRQFDPVDEEAARAMVEVCGGKIFSLKLSNIGDDWPSGIDVWPGVFKEGYDRYVYMRTVEDFEAMAKEFDEIHLCLRENGSVGVEV